MGVTALLDDYRSRSKLILDLHALLRAKKNRADSDMGWRVISAKGQQSPKDALLNDGLPWLRLGN